MVKVATLADTPSPALERGVTLTKKRDVPARSDTVIDLASAEATETNVHGPTPDITFAYSTR